ncbi:MAG: PD40 domain-containing protein [Nitrospirae bacterium]|nr:PD40 domain-containing protein [Nitrospirota bacterium]
MKARLFNIGVVFALIFFSLPAASLAQSRSAIPPLADESKFLRNITIPSGTILKPGEAFTKTWRIMNQGSTTWEDYQLAFIGGDLLGGPPFVGIPTTSPDQIVDVSIPMLAPVKPGEYRSEWRMRTPDGRPFGEIVYALITVKAVAPPTAPAARESRPILYLDVLGVEPVISAVPQEGASMKALVRSSDVGCLVCNGSFSAIWSPDGSRFAYIVLDMETGDSVLYVQDLDGKPARIMSDKEPMSESPVWSPDGRKIALLSHGITVVDVPEGTLHLFSLTGVKRIARSAGFMARPNKLRWSQDGRRILLSWGAAVILDTTTGQIEKITSHPVLAEWAPGDKGIYYFDILYKDSKAGVPLDWGGFYFRPLGAPESIRLTEAEALKQALELSLQDLVGAALWPGFLTLSPKGNHLAVIIRKSELQETFAYLYDLQHGGLIALDAPSRRIRIKDMLTSVDWSPNEKALAGAGMADGRIGIKLLDLETESWTSLTVVPPTEAVGSLYGYGFKTLSWTK